MTPIEGLGPMRSVPVPVEAVLDCGSLELARVLKLKPGSVIRSLRAAGDNIDLHAGGKLIGYGEIIAMEGVIGVRITQLKDDR